MAPLAHNSHSMETWGKSGISKKKIFVVVVTSDENNLEPTSFTKALVFPLWQNAIAKEHSTLIKQGTWILTHLLLGKSVIEYKLVYKIKRNLEIGQSLDTKPAL